MNLLQFESRILVHLKIVVLWDVLLCSSEKPTALILRVN